VSRIDCFDLRVVNLYFFVDLDRVKVRDSAVMESVVDVSGLACRLFDSLVPESAGVVAVGMTDQDPGLFRDSPSGRWINGQC